MSQRGSRPKGAQLPWTNPTVWWAYSQKILLLSLAFSFGPTLLLAAQDSQPSTSPAKTVTLRVDGTERKVATSKDTVGALLHQEGICLHTFDRVEPLGPTTLTDGMTIRVTRITREMIKEHVSIKPQVVTRWNRRMTNRPVLISAGRAGVAEQTRVIWKKDGVVSQQWVQSFHVISHSQPAVAVRGNLPSRSGTGNRRVIYVVATAYDPGRASCGPHATGHTAIGMHATRGVVAVDPHVIPLGSRLYVDGYGPAIAADTGGAIKGHRIDVCFPNRSEALRWGRRYVSVVILR